MVDYQDCTDYVHCSPMFHGIARDDGIIMQATVTDHWIVKLVMVFTLIVGQSKCHIALIDRMKNAAKLSKKDQDFGFYRVVEDKQNLTRYIFVPALSFLRGVPLIEDMGKDGAGEYLLWDIVDSDMGMRLQQLRPELFS